MNIKELADIGATFARAKLIELDNGESFLTVSAALPHDFAKDQPAREAFAQAVINAFLEGVGDVPSTKDLLSIFQSRWHEIAGMDESHSAGLEAVRTAILAAVAKDMQRRGEKEMASYEELCAKNQMLHDKLAAVRALPEKWKNSHSSHANFAKRLDSHVRDAMDDCANELETALNGKLPVVDKEREAFEVWWEGMEGDLRECSYAWVAWQAARKQPTQQPS